VPRPSSAWAGSFVVILTNLTFANHRPQCLSRIPCQHALGVEAFSAIRSASFPHVQLLSQTRKIRRTPRTLDFRAVTRAGARRIRSLRLRICSHAGACASTGKRARARQARKHHAIAEAVGCPEVGPTSGRTLLAGAILRFQCLERAEVCRKTSLYSSKSCNAWSSVRPGAMAMEQFSPLCERRDWTG
jgi:hypothetical protein